jgi:hypothetical protein
MGESATIATVGIADRARSTGALGAARKLAVLVVGLAVLVVGGGEAT